MSLLLLFGLVLLFAFGSDVKGISNGVGYKRITSKTPIGSFMLTVLG